MALKKLVTNSLNDDAVTAAKVENAINTTLEFVVPAGGIIMWSGSTGNIPSGWALCDGNNGTPNLTNKFVIGAGNSYAVNATGGSKDAVVVSHTHGITDNGHFHSMEYTNTDSNDGRSEESGNGGVAGTHNTSTNTTGITINSQGVSGTDKNLPPYLALAYIMKLA
jgi:microcystin-dependent protein